MGPVEAVEASVTSCILVEMGGNPSRGCSAAFAVLVRCGWRISIPAAGWPIRAAVRPLNSIRARGRAGILISSCLGNIHEQVNQCRPCISILALTDIVERVCSCRGSRKTHDIAARGCIQQNLEDISGVRRAGALSRTMP